MEYLAPSKIESSLNIVGLLSAGAMLDALRKIVRFSNLDGERSQGKRPDLPS
jgi:hypothetical protein